MRSLRFVLACLLLASLAPHQTAAFRNSVRPLQTRLKPQRSAADHAKAQLAKEFVVVHRTDKRTNICAEVDMPAMAADVAVRLARMSRGPCTSSGFSQYIESRTVSNRFGTFTARFFSSL